MHRETSRTHLPIALLCLLGASALAACCARPLWAWNVVPPGKKESAPAEERVSAIEERVGSMSVDIPADPNAPGGLTDFRSPFLVSSEGNVFVRGEVEGLYSMDPIQELRLVEDPSSQNCRDDIEAMINDDRLVAYTLICLSVAPEIKKKFESADPPR